MTVDASNFRQYVIAPALAVLAPAGIAATKTAADLLMATAATESRLGTWLHQVDGPALGVFQIDPVSLTDLEMRLNAAQRVALHGIMTPMPISLQIPTNLLLASAICRLFYWFVPEPLPPDTVSGLWGYYKAHYNTVSGAATEADFLAALKLTDLESLPPT